jgi:hypothetical protein
MQTLFVKNTLPVAANFSFPPTLSTSFNNIVGDSFNLQLSVLLPFNKTVAVKSWSASALPAGLTLNSTSGVISGTFLAQTPAANKTTTVSISITSKQFSGTITIPVQLTFVVKAYAAPVINSNQVFQQKTGVALNFSPTYSGTISSWSATGLPSGLSINSSTGAITGTYTGSSGTYTVTINGSNVSGSSSATITIQFPVTSISISNPVYYFNYGTYTQVFSTLSADSYITSVNSTTLPQGLSASVSNNILTIQGTSQASLGAYQSTISLTNINGTYSQQITINIINGIPLIDSVQSVPVTYLSSLNQQLFLSQPNYTPSLNPVSGYDPTVSWKINGSDSVYYSGLLGGIGITTGGLLTGTYNPTYSGSVAPKQFLLNVSAVNYSGTGTVNIPVNITTIAPSFKTTIPEFNSSIESSVNILASDYIDDYPNIFKPITSFGTTYLLNGFSINSTGRITGISNACTSSLSKIATVAVNPGNGSTIYQDIFGNVSGGMPKVPAKQTGIATINNTFIYQLNGNESTCRPITGWATNSLASGISLNSGNGVVITSNNIKVGSYKANVTGKNQFGSSVTELTININDYDSNLKFYKGEINRIVDSTSIIAGHTIDTVTCGKFIQTSNSNIFSDDVYYADTQQTVSQVTSNTGNYLMTYYPQVNTNSACAQYIFNQPLYIYSDLVIFNSGNKITGFYNTSINSSLNNNIILDLNTGIRGISSVLFSGQDSTYVNSLGLNYLTGNNQLFIYATGKANKYNLNTTGDIITANIYVINPIGKISQYSYKFTGITYQSGITSVASTGQVYHISDYSPTQITSYPILLDTYSDFKSAPTDVVFDSTNSRFTSTIQKDPTYGYVKNVYLNVQVTGLSGIFSITGKYINNGGLTSINTTHTVHMYNLAQFGRPQLGSPKAYDTYYKTITGFVNSPISYTITGLDIDPETVWTIGNDSTSQSSQGYADDAKELYFRNSTDKYYNNYPTITGLPTKSILNTKKVIQATNRFGTSKLYLDFKIDSYNPLSIPALDVGIYNLYKNSEYVLISGGIGIILSSGGYYKGNTQAIASVNAVKNNLSYYLSQNHVDDKYVLPVTGGPTTGDALFSGIYATGCYAVYVVFGSDLSTSAYGQSTFYLNPGHLSSISGQMLSSISKVTGWQINDTGIIAKYGYFTGAAPIGATGSYLFEKVPVFSLSGFDNIKRNIYVTGFSQGIDSANGTYTLNVDVTGLDSKYTQAVWSKGPAAYTRTYIPGPSTTGYIFSGQGTFLNAYEAGSRLSGIINPSNTYYYDPAIYDGDNRRACGSYPNYTSCPLYVLYKRPDSNTWIRISSQNIPKNLITKSDIINTYIPQAVDKFNAIIFSDYGTFKRNTSGNLNSGLNGFLISGDVQGNWKLFSGNQVRGTGSGIGADLFNSKWNYLTKDGSFVNQNNNGNVFIDEGDDQADTYGVYPVNTSTSGNNLSGVTWFNGGSFNRSIYSYIGATSSGKYTSGQITTELSPGTWYSNSDDFRGEAIGFVISYDENRTLGIYKQSFYVNEGMEFLTRIAYDTGIQPKAYNKWPWEASGKWVFDDNMIQITRGYYYTGAVNLIISGDNQSQTPLPDSAIYSGLKLGDIPRFSMDTSGNIKAFIGGRFEGLSGRTPPQISIKLADYYGRILKDELTFDSTVPDRFEFNGRLTSVSSKADDISIRNFIK